MLTTSVKKLFEDMDRAQQKNPDQQFSVPFLMLRTLGIAGALHTFGLLPNISARSRGQATVNDQGAGPTACSIIDVAELKRLTGRTDILRRGPVQPTCHVARPGVASPVGKALPATPTLYPRGTARFRRARSAAGWRRRTSAR